MTMTFSQARLEETYKQCQDDENLDPKQLADRIAKLAEIGWTENGGISRFVYTNEEKQAKALFRSWMENTGMSVREDDVGNMFGRIEGKTDGPVLMTGSHLDTVPDGGAFDGALGCLSSLMALESLLAEGFTFSQPVELVVMVDEEGTRFGNGLFGSRVMLGEVTEAEVRHALDEDGVTLQEAMDSQGFTLNGMAESFYPPEHIKAFLELHIEQGTTLEQAKKPVGVVSGIAGPSWHECSFYGETDHAGNTPMTDRRDAFAALSELALELEKLPAAQNDTAVATIGKVQLHPNGSNVIAGQADAVLDIRDVSESARDAVIDAARQKAYEIAERRGLQMNWHEQLRVAPVLVPEKVQQAVRTGAESAGISHMPVISGAAHDAMNFGKYTNAGMIFVPSVAGKSHTPEEFTHLHDAFHGTIAMREALRALNDADL
ncbi:allantoate deiminase [Salsuginibacillus halophilus]|uniref:Allantoate deiminase n=1 Tax=Salsuginibacillus halophilus TaxID=517424 RepID=A0A2P8HI42_9BACI|nr:Zn-dependent hydrolase [Salsuginibacillus halophilus]PSL45894.1 allantoate deiminase [Salsuginibacillus halophilus]